MATAAHPDPSLALPHALLMTQATAEAQAEAHPDERVYTVTGAPGRFGIQALRANLSGDNTTSWHTMRWNQRMALSMSLSGMFNVSATTLAASPARCPTPRC